MYHPAPVEIIKGIETEIEKKQEEVKCYRI